MQDLRIFMGSPINDMLTEQQLVNYALGHLNAAGHFVWRNNSGVSRHRYTNKAGITKDRVWRAGMRGASDIIGVTKNGHFIAVECKIGKNKATPHQHMFLDEIQRRNGYICLAYTPEQIEAFIKLIDKERG